MKKVLFVLVAILMIVTAVQAKDVTLEWDENVDADYYVVYWGEASNNYATNSGNITEETYTVLNPENKKLFIAVKAFNNCGNSSDFSEEIIYECKEVPAVTGLKQSVNVTVDVNITIGE